MASIIWSRIAVASILCAVATNGAAAQSAVTAGLNTSGQCNVPSAAPWVQISSTGNHVAARRADGTIAAWGMNDYGQCNTSGECNVPPLAPGLFFVRITAGGSYSAAVVSDGTIRVWGGYLSSLPVPPAPAGLSYVDVAAGGVHLLARLSDGSVVAWGDTLYGQCSLPAPPPGTAFVQIAGGSTHSLVRYDVAAGSTAIGSGCGGAGSPILAVTPPRIGHNTVLTLSGATPAASGFVYGSAVPPAPVTVGGWYTAYVDLATFIPIVAATTDATGAYTTSFWITPDPGLVGLQAAMQAALFGTQGPLALDLSNGVLLLVGW